MPANRIEKSTEYMRHVFTEAERLQMGTQLAEAHNTLSSIDEEEAVVKAKFKERKATIEQSVGSLSRDLATGWTMQNVECRLVWDSPNPFEVSYVRNDTNEVVKVRPMTEQERQLDLPLQEPATEAAVEESVEKSQAAADGFFGTDEAEEEPGDPRLAVVPTKSGPAELQAFHEKEVQKEVKAGRGKKKATEEF
jgi:hypothetical protein